MTTPDAALETALDAAMAAQPDRHVSLGYWEHAVDRSAMRRVLEAARPHLVADERRWQAAAHQAVQRARQQIQEATEQALSAAVGYPPSAHIEAAILSEVRGCLDDIDQTIPETPEPPRCHG
jgi:hypothetical protein